MAEVAALYGLGIREAMSLSEKETTYMLEAAKVTMYNMALTSPDMKNMLRGRLTGVVRGVRDARSVRGEDEAEVTSTETAIGAPPV